MKDYSYLSMAALCLLFACLSSCGKVELPRETPLFLDQTSATIAYDQGNYLSGWNRAKIQAYVERKLSNKMQENRVKVQAGIFVNTPFKLTISNIRFRQSTGTAFRCPEDCGVQTISREKVRLDVDFELYKGGQLIKKWDFCDVSREGVYAEDDPYSDCPIYTTGSISTEAMLDRCIAKIQRKVSKSMRNNF